jgi:predicted nucleotidyltransferase
VQAFTGTAVRFAYLFGSQATGTARPDSDVDIAVSFEGSTDVASRRQLLTRCADELTRRTGLPEIALVDLDEVSLRFVGRVLREGRLLHSSDEALRASFESLTSRMADDLERWAAPLDRALLAARAPDGAP